MADDQELELQPDEAVTAESAEKQPEPDLSQSDDGETTEETELVLDAEGFQETKPNLNPDLPEYKAFKKEKEAKRRKQAIINEMVERDQQRDAELAHLREAVSNVARGKKPTLESCSYDEEAFEKALDHYNNFTVATDNQPPTQNGTIQQQQKQQPNQPPEIALDDHTEYAHFNNEQILKKSFKDYDQVVERLKDDLHESIQRNLSAEIPRESVVNAIINVGSTANVDMSKAMYALEKIPALKNELLQPKVLNSDILVADVLRKAEKAIKSGKSVRSKPPAEIKQGGPVDHSNASVKKAFDNWMRTGSAADHLVYKRAKKAVNNNGNSRQ